MSGFHLASRYSVFAVIATATNLLGQELSMRLYGGHYDLYLAIGVGTLAGLVCKYLLDKHYIFAYRTESHQENLGRFFAYTLTGVLTTALFWGLELGFDSLFGTRLGRYSGAVLGLSIGYAVKYRLDKHFVFRVRKTISQ